MPPSRPFNAIFNAQVRPSGQNKRAYSHFCSHTPSMPLLWGFRGLFTPSNRPVLPSKHNKTRQQQPTGSLNSLNTSVKTPFQHQSCTVPVPFVFPCPLHLTHTHTTLSPSLSYVSIVFLCLHAAPNKVLGICRAEQIHQNQADTPFAEAEERESR